MAILARVSISPSRENLVVPKHFRILSGCVASPYAMQPRASQQFTRRGNPVAHGFTSDGETQCDAGSSSVHLKVLKISFLPSSPH